ncbi:PAS domain S-box protein [Paenibacillus sp. GYB004]|uniref:PAS domain S-box protein n=1 Tax=Paenibacillus sp. GYB004 TaxID=2994393 RepID=UPI002F96157A
MEIIAGTYNGWLILFSFAVAVVSSYTVVTLIGRLGYRKDQLRIFTSAFMNSIGLWAVHYIALTAYGLPLPADQLFPFFFLSVTISFCTSYAAMSLFSGSSPGQDNLIAGSLLIGSGIMAIPFIGMQALRVYTEVEYDPLWIGFAWLLASVDAYSSVWLAYRLRRHGFVWRIACSFLMGIGIIGVHFTFIYGTTFRSTMPGMESWSISVNQLFASAVGMAALFILGICVMMVLVNQRLREAEQKFSSLFENSPDLVLFIDMEGCIVRSNPKASEIAGYDRSELTGRKLIEFISPEERKQAQESFIKAMSGQGHELEIGVVAKSGKRVELWVSSIPMIFDGIREGICVIAKNITADKKMKEELKRLTERHELILNTMVDGVYGLDMDRRTVFWNKAAEAMTGFAAEELIGRKAHGYVHHSYPDGSPYEEDDCPVYSVLDDPRTHTISEDMLWRKDGTSFFVEYTVSPIMGSSSDSAAAVVTFRDITERKRHENALLQSEAQYRTLVENLPDALIVVKEDKSVYANDTAVRMLGGSRKEDVLRRTVFEKVSPECMELDRLIQAPECEEQLPLQSSEHRFKRPDGQMRDIDIITFSAWYEGSPARYMLMRDVTELKQARELIQRSEKLAVAGELAAGIAHEIRNPLTAIKGFIQLMKERISPSYYEVIQSEISRIELITGELLMLSRPQAILYQPRNMAVLLDHVATLLETQAIMCNVVIVRRYNTASLNVSCDENQVKQVFINLVKNAIEAMPEGGTVTLEARMEADELLIAVRDEGIGIPEDKLGKLGQPFYTTKDKGTGLGLMISMNIIEHHEGRVRVYSQVGKGTEFQVLLPVVRPPETAAEHGFPLN